MSLRIITDSTADITTEQAAQMGITIVPLKVIFGEKEYRDGIDISIEGFYEKLVTAEKLPTTSQPAPDDFLKYFEEAKEVGDSVLVILISSKLSGTYQSAVIAKEMCEYSEISIVDSITTITNLRLLVEHAIKLREQQIPMVQIADELEELKQRTVLLAMVDTLEFLHKGGRLSKSSAILGTLLKFKPIITVKDGVVSVVDKERGTNKGIARILEIIDEYGSIDKNYPVMFGYSSEDSKALMLQEKVIEKYDLKDTRIYPVGCVIGTHAGPGACFITYIKK
ncbi:MAG: DegV family protein [Herbinix sp.]|jgi:DegV family protein with EDD domain|nr:DegV family protein [Herbinix sp.]